MRWSDLPLRPSRRMLRQFAGLWMAFFGGLALWYGLARGESTTAIVLAVIAATIGPLGLAVPSALRPVFVAWMMLAFPIGWAVSRIVLLVLFAAIVTPIALVFRVSGRDALALRPRRGQTTYWAKKPAPPDLASYFRQS